MLDLYINGKNIISIVSPVIVVLIFVNFSIMIIEFLFNKLIKWYEKRTAEKYNFYEWLGNPHHPISFYEEFSSKKDFETYNFRENCKIIKEKILQEMIDLNELKGYKIFLELKTQSPRLNSLLSSSQTILIAVIVSTLITFLNFSDIKINKLIVSYMILIIFGVGLLKMIDFMSKAIDRNKLLLILVNECIQEKESLKEKLVEEEEY